MNEPETGNGLVLNWVDGVTGEAGWRVQRSIDGQNFEIYAPYLSADTETWKDTNVIDGTRYWYRVRAYGNGKDTAYTPKRAATTVLAAPIDVIARAASPTSADLIWRSPSRGATRFIVQRSSNGGASFDNIAFPTVSRYRDTGLTAGQTYQYRVRAENQPGQVISAFTATVNVTTPASSGVSILDAEATDSEHITFSWTTVANTTEYRIEVSEDGIDFGDGPVTARPDSVTEMQIERLDPDSVVYLRVQAYNGDTLIGSTNIASATTARPEPDVPGFVTAVEVGDDVEVSWVADRHSEYFLVQRDIDGAGFTDRIVVPFGTYSFTDDTVSAGATTVTYRVKAVNTTGVSVFSDEAIAGPPSGGEPEQQPPQRWFLISFYGAQIGNPDSQGNDWFLRQAIHNVAAATYGYDTLNTTPGNPNEPIGGPYRDFDGPDALPELLDAIDHDNNFEITQAEIAAVEVRLLGWSLGAVEALTVSRFLADVEHYVGTGAFRTRYHLHAPIPVQDLVLIDPVVDGLAPLTVRIARPVLNNVQDFVNYYQRRGGISTMDYYLPGLYPFPFAYIDSYVYPRSQVDPFPIDLRGNTIRSQAANPPDQIRVDNLGFLEVSYPWVPPGGTTAFDGAMIANQVNHSTIVWWIQGDVVADLG